MRSEDEAREAGRIVAAFPPGSQPAIPLLVSIEDPRDVATVRATTAGEPERDPWQGEQLARLVESRGPQSEYTPRIAERSDSPPSSYRLAVTASGITDGEPDPIAPIPQDRAASASTMPLGLLWIGVPLATHAGLLVLLGAYDDDVTRPDARVWPLPLSSSLGVRIYESPHPGAA